MPIRSLLVIACLSPAMGCGGDGHAARDASAAGDAGRMDASGTDGEAPDDCVTDHEVTLPGHEGQFFGTPNRWCQTFVPGVPNGALVVVGTDVAGVGDHDCTLRREVRYHVTWGDGTCEWTDWIERCDVRVGVEHTYEAPGEYVAAVFAEDREGGRTRSDDKSFTVVAEGGDAFVFALGGTLEGDTLRFEQTAGTYAMSGVDTVVVAYRLRDCDGVETELERRTVELPAPGADSVRRLRETVEVALPAGTTEGQLVVEIDPDHTLTQTCPESGSPPHTRGTNDLTRVDIAFCPGDVTP